MSAVDRISMFHLGRADGRALAAGGIGRALAEAWTGQVWESLSFFVFFPPPPLILTAWKPGLARSGPWIRPGSGPHLGKPKLFFF